MSRLSKESGTFETRELGDLVFVAEADIESILGNQVHDLGVESCDLGEADV